MADADEGPGPPFAKSESNGLTLAAGSPLAKGIPNGGTPPPSLTAGGSPFGSDSGDERGRRAAPRGWGGWGEGAARLLGSLRSGPGRSRVDLGSISGQSRFDPGSISVRSRVNLGPISGLSPANRATRVTGGFSSHRILSVSVSAAAAAAAAEGAWGRGGWGEEGLGGAPLSGRSQSCAAGTGTG